MRNIINLILVVLIIVSLAVIAFLVNERNNKETKTSEIEKTQEEKDIEKEEVEENIDKTEDEKETELDMNKDSRVSLESPKEDYVTTGILPIVGSISDYYSEVGIYFAIFDSEGEEILEQFHFFDNENFPTTSPKKYSYEFSRIMDLREDIKEEGKYVLVVRTYDQHSKGVEFADEYKVNFTFKKN